MRFTKTAPNLWSIDGLRESGSPINADDMFDQDVDCIAMGLSLLVNFEGFLVQTRVDRNVGNLRCVVIVEFLNVVADTSRISLDCSEDQKILQVLILAKGGWFEDDLFEQLDQFGRQIGVQECLDSNGDIIRIG